MQLKVNTEGVEFVVSRPPQPKNDNDGRQKTDRETDELLHVTELVAMDDTGAEVIKVTTAGQTRVDPTGPAAPDGRCAGSPWSTPSPSPSVNAGRPLKPTNRTRRPVGQIRNVGTSSGLVAD
jgi:hypothetical protein